MLKCTNTLDNRAKWGYTCAIAKKQMCRTTKVLVQQGKEVLSE